MTTTPTAAPANYKEAAIAFLTQVTSGKIREAYRTYVGPEFRHHNPYFRGDGQSLMIGMEENHVKFPDKILAVQRTLQDGNFVAVHSNVKLMPGDINMAVVHIFRFEGNLIAELWDIGQPVPENCANEQGMF
ncbi:MAG: nuclear transport factor 2 family protein [Pseudomonadota bacterium]